MQNEIDQLDLVIPSYEYALVNISGLMRHAYKPVFASTLIGPYRGGFAVVVGDEMTLDKVGYMLQEQPYTSYQEALSALGAMMDDINARMEGKAEWKDEAWWEDHDREIKEKYGFDIFLDH